MRSRGPRTASSPERRSATRGSAEQASRFAGRLRRPAGCYDHRVGQKKASGTGADVRAPVRSAVGRPRAHGCRGGVRGDGFDRVTCAQRQPDGVGPPGDARADLRGRRGALHIPNALARGLRRSRTMTMGSCCRRRLCGQRGHHQGRRAPRRRGGLVVLIADAEEFGPTGIAYQRLVMEGASTAAGREQHRWGECPRVACATCRCPSCTSIGVVGNRASACRWTTRRGIALAVDHLAGSGTRELGHVAGPSEIDTARRRRAGYALGCASTASRRRPAGSPEASLTKAGGLRCDDQRCSRTRRPADRHGHVELRLGGRGDVGDRERRVASPRGRLGRGLPRCRDRRVLEPAG